MRFDRYTAAIGVIALLATCGTPQKASSLTLEELKRYDQNGNQVIDAGHEEKIYILHLQNNILRKFDTNPLNGKLDPAEVVAIEQAIIGSEMDKVCLDFTSEKWVPLCSTSFWKVSLVVSVTVGFFCSLPCSIAGNHLVGDIAREAQ